MISLDVMETVQDYGMGTCNECSECNVSVKIPQGAAEVGRSFGSQSVGARNHEYESSQQLLLEKESTDWSPYLQGLTRY